jgi:zinc transporter ZupT
MPIIFTIATFFSTLFGGLLGIRYKDKLHLILGFTAGVVLGVVSFDIFPEIIKLIEKTGTDPIKPMVALVVGLLVFHMLEKLILIHSTHEESYSEHKHPSVGVASGLALSGHSFFWME